MRLYLASTSPARRMLLGQAGVQPIVIPSHVDEDAALDHVAQGHGLEVSALSPALIVLELARAKALAVADHSTDPGTGGPLDGLVVGGDSMFELDGVVYGKPYTPEAARERWLAQRGKTGTLWSGQWLVDRRGGATGEGVGAVASAQVTFAADLSDAEIDAYVATGEPLQVAGAFTIDSLGAPYIDRVEGDPSTVVGMSLPTLRRLVQQLGVQWHELWSERERD